jgi:hypothetical protein
VTPKDTQVKLYIISKIKNNNGKANREEKNKKSQRKGAKNGHTTE